MCYRLFQDTWEDVDPDELSYEVSWPRYVATLVGLHCKTICIFMFTPRIVDSIF